jgi:hypothetical protein
MPSGDIKLQNLNYCAKNHCPNGQNPLAPWVRQTKQDADNQECRGVFDIMGRVSRRPKVRRHHCEHDNGQQRRPRRNQKKLPRHYRYLFAAHAARTMPIMNASASRRLLKMLRAGLRECSAHRSRGLLSAPYRSGPSRDWIKVKNPSSPVMIRAREAEW